MDRIIGSYATVLEPADPDAMDLGALGRIFCHRQDLPCIPFRRDGRIQVVDRMAAHDAAIGAHGSPWDPNTTVAAAGLAVDAVLMPQDLWVDSLDDLLDGPHGSWFVLAMDDGMVGVVGRDGMLRALRDLADDRRSEAVAARAAAVRSLEAVERFFAAMSHEMRTPLTAIIGFADILTSGDEVDAALRDDMLGHVRVAGGDLLRLVDDVLDLAKASNGGLTPRPVPCDLPPLVDGVVSMFRTAVQPGVEVRIDIADAAGTVRCDDHLVRRVVGNLVGNAAKFTDAGRIDVVLRRADGVATLVVTDTGCGMTDAMLAVVGNPFAVRPETGRLAKAGTGLGLHIVSRIRAAMGGRLVLDHGDGGRGVRATATWSAPAD